MKSVSIKCVFSLILFFNCALTVASSPGATTATSAPLATVNSARAWTWFGK